MPLFLSLAPLFMSFVFKSTQKWYLHALFLSLVPLSTVPALRASNFPSKIHKYSNTKAPGLTKSSTHSIYISLILQILQKNLLLNCHICIENTLLQLL